MEKIGEYWIPDIDAAEGYNIERARLAFENGRGIQIHHLLRAIELMLASNTAFFDTAIDGGANIGSWSRVLAEYYGIVFSFEPHKEAYACLERNINDWSLGNIVKTYNAALSDTYDMVAVEPSNAGSRTVTSRVVGSGEIESCLIDDLHIDNCSFIKFDLEGYEAKALRGAENTIAVFRPWIMIENKNDASSKMTESEILLKSWNYKLVEKIGDNQIDWLFSP